jgi:hypothetical protein
MRHSIAGSVIFGRSTSIRRSTAIESSKQDNKPEKTDKSDKDQLDRSEENDENIDGKNAHQAHIKVELLRREVAEKEACSVLRSLCQDAAKLLPPSELSLDISDLLSGIMLLGNLCKRIGYEKDQLEIKIQKLQKEHSLELSNKDIMVW